LKEKLCKLFSKKNRKDKRALKIKYDLLQW
jgi:hypothetical protein